MKIPMELMLIRHGKTEGNLKKRYIGRTDEELCGQGRDEICQYIQEHRYDDWQNSDLIFASPMLRCRQTAELIFPGRAIFVIPEYRETDFGEFENKNYLELAENVHYRQWIDSNGTLPFPGGESREEVRDRCIAGFHKMLEICDKAQAERVACVVHGGTIMQLLESYGRPEKSFYDYACENGGGYVCQVKRREGEVICGRNMVEMCIRIRM